MNNVARMAIVDAIHNLMEKTNSIAFLDATMGHNIIKQFTPRRIAHDEENILGRIHDLIQLDDVWMIDLLEDVNFTRHTLYIGRVDYTVFFQDFDGHLTYKQ